MRIIGMSLALLALAIVSAVSATPEYPLEWHWVRVVPGARTPWEVQQSAVARASFTGDRFTAWLYDAANKDATGEAQIILKGRTQNGHITAVETIVDTDAGLSTLHGTIVRGRTRLTDPSNGWGEDRISLVDGAEFMALPAWSGPVPHPENRLVERRKLRVAAGRIPV